MRYDHRLAVGYGSAWHLLRCLGWQRARFTSKIAAEVGATQITWLDFPAFTGKKCYPPGVPIRDGEWERVDFIPDPKVKAASAWPTRGEQQNWDAVGKALIGKAEEWLLVEAKAHPGEIKSNGTDASEAGGRPIIRAAFERTLRALGYTEEIASTRAEEWLRGYYQHANRLAALHLLTERGIAARIIFVYFCGDIPDRLEDDFLHLLKTRIPFVNGGLFDCLDEVFTNEEKAARKKRGQPAENIRLDDFSEERDNPLCIPNELFFGDERDVDLSGIYEDQRRQKEKVRGLIEILVAGGLQQRQTQASQ